ncbi:MAG: hypothetical protein K0R76_17 [Alphaproteobacteria bacterium]|jgi:hypothetical protein|nr:hypothetical protein [Alphaproteobacteria bacterium]MDF3033063.1 hypothetical protein [Alphaproteobacteria bacterium]
MRTIREEIGESINKKKAQDLYSTYITLALETRKKRENRILFESYYQRAEYYLHLMNDLNDGLSVTPARVAKSAQ